MRTISISMFVLLLIGVIVIRELAEPSTKEFISKVQLLFNLELDRSIEKALV